MHIACASYTLADEPDAVFVGYKTCSMQQLGSQQPYAAVQTRLHSAQQSCLPDQTVLPATSLLGATSNMAHCVTGQHLLLLIKSLLYTVVPSAALLFTRTVVATSRAAQMCTCFQLLLSQASTCWSTHSRHALQAALHSYGEPCLTSLHCTASVRTSVDKQ